MASKLPLNNPSQNSHGAKLASGGEDRCSEDRLQPGASLPSSRLDRPQDQDVYNLDATKKIPLRPGPLMSDGPEDSHQAMKGMHREMTGPATRLDSDAQDRGAEKMAEPDTSAKQTVNTPDVCPNQDETIGSNSDCSPPV
ncbi:hypothetical protein V5O48_019144, partial [Marasmius crinis-equi]